MFSKRVVFLVCCIVCVLAFTPTSLFSQAANTGSIAGTVLDAQGAAVTGASVTITDTSTNIERTAVTNETGRYIFVDVPPGTYNVAVTKTGFRVAKLPKQVVSVGLALTLNVSLDVGAVTESIEVIASGAELQPSTQRSAILSVAISFRTFPLFNATPPPSLPSSPVFPLMAALPVQSSIRAPSCSMAARTPTTWTAA